MTESVRECDSGWTSESLFHNEWTQWTELKKKEFILMKLRRITLSLSAITSTEGGNVSSTEHDELKTGFDLFVGVSQLHPVIKLVH